MHRKKIRLELSAFLGLDVALPEVVDGWLAFSTRDEVDVSRVKHEPLSTTPHPGDPAPSLDNTSVWQLHSYLLVTGQRTEVASF